MADGLSEDPAAYLACLPGSSAPESLVCTGTEIFLEGQNPPCGEGPPTTTAGPTTEPATTPEPFACSAVSDYFKILIYIHCIHFTIHKNSKICYSLYICRLVSTGI